jgi:hydroxylaminobenzene mutase
MQRHPDDPDPVRASKARAVWWLGLLAVLTGPLVGGIVPATVALVLAGEFRREAYPASGFLTGASVVRRGERLAWTGIVLVTLALATAVVIGLLRFASTPTGPDFPPTVN